MFNERASRLTGYRVFARLGLCLSLLAKCGRRGFGYGNVIMHASCFGLFLLQLNPMGFRICAYMFVGGRCGLYRVLQIGEALETLLTASVLASGMLL